MKAFSFKVFSEGISFKNYDELKKSWCERLELRSFIMVTITLQESVTFMPNV